MKCPGFGGLSGDDHHARLIVNLNDSWFQCAGCHQRFLTEAGKARGFYWPADAPSLNSDDFCNGCKTVLDKDCLCEICDDSPACYVCHNGVCERCATRENSWDENSWDEYVELYENEEEY